MNCDILIRSYYKDFTWLRYCLQSVDKYCHGFRNVILVVPESSVEKLRWMGLWTDHTRICQNYADDYLGQQVTKLLADTLTDADYICHVDSDCVFYRCFTPDELIEGGKVEIAITPYGQFRPHISWKAVTEKFLKIRVEYDFMRRQPMVFPRWLYPSLRDYARTLHGVDIETYITAQPPHGFSEFNALGAYAHYFHRDRLRWRETGIRASNQDFCKWYWSWGGINQQIREEIQRILT